MSTIASQKVGNEIPMSAKVIVIRSARPPRLTDERMPSGMPMMSQSTTPPSVSVIVYGNRSPSSVFTGTLLRQE